MIAWILSILALTASAVPLSPDVLSPPPPQGVSTQCQVDVANQIAEVPTPAALTPAASQPQSSLAQHSLVQSSLAQPSLAQPLPPQPSLQPLPPQPSLQPSLAQPSLPPSLPQQQNPQPGPHFMPFLQHYGWPPVGGNPLMVPLQPSVPGTQAANQAALPQQPLVFPPYGYYPLLTPPYTNQLISPYGFPVIPHTALPQTPNTQTPSGEPAPGPAPSAAAPQPTQQQQNPQIVYMLQQPMTPPLGSISSEELQMVAQMGRLGAFLPAVFANPPAGAAEPVSQAAMNALPAAATSQPGAQQTAGLGPERRPERRPRPDGIQTPALGDAV